MSNALNLIWFLDEYILITKYIVHLYEWYDKSFIYFMIAKMLAVIFGNFYY